MTSAPLAQAFLGAAEVVAAVLGGRNLDSVLAAATHDGVLRAAVRDLAAGALRHGGRGDYLLGRLLERPLGSAEVRALLLCALQRLEVRPGDAHTSVDQAVDAAKQLAHGRYAGLVNGVLRSFLRRRDELLAAADADAVACHRHPRWWLDRLAADHPADWPAIAAAGNTHPPMCLRVNLRHGDAAAYVARLAAAGIAAHALDATAVMLAAPVGIDQLQGFAAGDVSVQDWGAQHAAPLLDVRPGMRVLDACAAPGGKTGHLLESADCELTALDSDAARLARVDANLVRLGLSARLLVADCAKPAAWWDGRPYDRILADVPCSASGVVRRHPDIKLLRRSVDIAKFARQQAAILDALWQTLAPGGRMLYCTCSVFAAENARQMAAFAQRHANALRLPTGGEHTEWQLLPDADHDGFYYALLEKRA
jgi:16S rRNA (cytosine967-C5)-methyltransferase